MHMIGNELTGGTPTSRSVVLVLSVSIFIVTRTFMLLSESLSGVGLLGVGRSVRLFFGSLGGLKIDDSDSLICSVDEEVDGNVIGVEKIEDEDVEGDGDEDEVVVEEDEVVVEEDEVVVEEDEEDEMEEGVCTGAISLTFSVSYSIERLGVKVGVILSRRVDPAAISSVESSKSSISSRSSILPGPKKDLL